jgi:pimeloyl-ACP methyl ester carboxylesterase
MAAALPPGYTLTRLSIPVAKGVQLTGVAATRPDAENGVLFWGGGTFRVRTDGAAVLRALTGAAPVNVVLLDYPGTGTSGGAPTLASVTAHAIAAHDWIAARPTLAPGGLIVHGQSFGGFVATSVAEARTVRGVVLHGAATSARELANESVRTSLRAWWTRPARPFIRVTVDRSLAREDNRVRLGHYRGPVLVLVGADDALTPPAMARSLAAASASPRELRQLVVLPGSDRQTVLSNPRFGAVSRAFLDSVVRVGRAREGD